MRETAYQLQLEQRDQRAASCHVQCSWGSVDACQQQLQLEIAGVGVVVNVVVGVAADKLLVMLAASVQRHTPVVDRMSYLFYAHKFPSMHDIITYFRIFRSYH